MKHFHQLSFLIPALSLLTLSAAFTHAEDWPRWLGPNASNHVADTSFDPDLAKWDVDWKSEVGLGYSSVIISNDKAFTLGHDAKGQETVFCLDAKSGKLIWSSSYPAELLPRMHLGGPNASPTVTDSGLLSMSKDGQIMLLNLEDGKTKWTQELGKILKIETPTWGFASSPVVLGDRVYLAAGQVAALDLKTGKTIWVSETKYHPGYTTVVPFQKNGKSFIASLGGKELIVLNQGDGTEVARQPFKARYDMVASTPMVSNDGSHIFISGNMGSEMLSFDGQKLELSWENRDVKSSLNNSVLQGSVIYGISGNHKSSASQLIAFNATDGSIRWSADRFGYGSTIGIGSTLLVLTESGDLVTTPMQAEGFKEISRKTVLDSICWTPPTYANGRIYVRNDEGDLVCLAPKK